MKGWPELYGLLPDKDSDIKLPAIANLNERIGI